MIAMALSCNPSILIADEPTTALDVTVQAQILELMKSLQTRFGMSIIYITHNLGVIAEMSDDVAVMYLGKIVESASVDDVRFLCRLSTVRRSTEHCPGQGRIVESNPGPSCTWE